MTETNTSPDMIKLSSVITVITNNEKRFNSTKDMAKVINDINSLTKYDLKPVADTNYNTTINLVDGRSKVRHFIDKIKEGVSQ